MRVEPDMSKLVPAKPFHQMPRALFVKLEPPIVTTAVEPVPISEVMPLPMCVIVDWATVMVEAVVLLHTQMAALPPFEICE